MGIHRSAEGFLAGSKEDCVPFDWFERDRWIPLCVQECIWEVDLVQQGHFGMLVPCVILQCCLTGAG